MDYAPTLSCYDPTPAGAHCGRCDACRLRAKGFSEAESGSDQLGLNRRLIGSRKSITPCKAKGRKRVAPRFLRFAGCNLWSDGKG